VKQSSGIIVHTVESGFFVAPPKAHASNVYVISYTDGRVRSFSGPPSAVDRRRSRFCYIVDVGEQRVQRTFEVPSAEDAYSFSVEVSATWKVENAETVVKANLSNGNDVVLGRLQDDLWTVVRRYPRSGAIQAEDAARRAFQGRRELAEGLVILRADVRIRTDVRLVRATQEMHSATHQSNLDATRMDGLRRMMEGGDDAFVLMHLIRNPDDTAGVLQLMIEAKDNDRSAHLALLDRMLEHKLITDGDAQPLRDRVLGPPAPSSWTMQPISGGRGSAGSSALPTSSTPQSLPASSGASHQSHRPVPTANSTVAQTSTAQTSRAQTSRAASTSSAATDAIDTDSSTTTGGVKSWRQLNRRPDQGGR
jgi:hypothetical protein